MRRSVLLVGPLLAVAACGGPSDDAVADRVNQACRPLATALGTDYMPGVTPDQFNNLRKATSAAGDKLRVYASGDLSGDAQNRVRGLADALISAGTSETPSEVMGGLEAALAESTKISGARCDAKLHRANGEKIEETWAAETAG